MAIYRGPWLTLGTNLFCRLRHSVPPSVNCYNRLLDLGAMFAFADHVAIRAGTRHTTPHLSSATVAEDFTSPAVTLTSPGDAFTSMVGGLTSAADTLTYAADTAFDQGPVFKSRI